jgi:hypothetical protein
VRNHGGDGVKAMILVGQFVDCLPNLGRGAIDFAVRRVLLIPIHSRIRIICENLAAMIGLGSVSEMNPAEPNT